MGIPEEGVRRSDSIRQRIEGGWRWRWRQDIRLGWNRKTLAVGPCPARHWEQMGRAGLCFVVPVRPAHIFGQL